MKRFLSVVLAALVLTSAPADNGRASVSVTNAIGPVLPFGGAQNLASCYTAGVGPGVGAILTDWRTFAINISYWNGGGGAATAVTMQCWNVINATSDPFVSPNAKFFLQVITATSASGVSTTATNTWSQAVSGGCTQIGATKSSSCAWTWIVTNLVSAAMKCQFCGTGGNANDNLYADLVPVTP